jgi:formylglycine-generating enzyme required for sulfatase activity
MMCEPAEILCGDERERAGDFPVMVEIPAGEFIMGENERDKFATDTERPAHRVKIASAFALGKFPVTVGEFRKFRNEHSMLEASELPVARVSWDDAVAYCKWLSETSGRSYRLPSEAEWEYACRAGSRGPFPGGDEISSDDANFLYDESGARVGIGKRTALGVFPPNSFGLHDMQGNVCEWVADSWHADYAGAPVDGAVWTSADSSRVIRGGAWDYLPRLLRSSWRDWRLAKQRADNIGFRVATSEVEKTARA